MVNLLIYEYFFKYKQARNEVRNLIINNDLSTAQNLLSNYLTEHDSYFAKTGLDPEGTSFTEIDNNSLHHAADHIVSADTQPQQKQATIDALND